MAGTKGTKLRKRAREEDLDVRPWTEADDLSAWEVVADGAEGPLGLVVSVEVEPPYVRAVVEAAHRDGLSIQQYVQRHVRELGEALVREGGHAGVSEAQQHSVEHVPAPTP